MDNKDNKEVLLLKKALERQKRARQQAEQILEAKAMELYDVTKHLKDANNKLENLLNERTSELDGVFITIIDPYIVMDLRYDVINMNSSAKEFLGYDHTKEKVNLKNLVHKDYLEYTAESIKSLLEVGILKNYRAKILTKNKEEKWVQINGSLIYDADRKPIAAQGVLRDVTQEMEIKELLSEQKKQLDIIVENSPLGIVLSVQGKIIKSNNAFSTLLGYDDTELKQLSITQIAVPENENESDELSMQMNQGKLDKFTTIKKYKCKNGTPILGKTLTSAVRDARGNIEFEVALIEDITKQRLLEQQKEVLMKELETSNKGLQEYAHIVSHDLKSPLRSISALATWIQEDYKDVLDDTGNTNLELMQEKLAYMDKLIHGILEYSTTNNSELASAEVDLNTVVAEIRETIFIPDHVQLLVPQKLPIIQSDKVKMRQVFQNIIGNAVVHIKKEKGLVEVLWKEDKTHWVFTIKDNGVGIPKEYHKKIFEIFQSIGTSERSSGIGLSIVKKIVNRYDGEVWIDSEIGKGTEFHFSLSKGFCAI